MKTPREILLERHRAIEQKLHEIREKIVSLEIAAAQGGVEQRGRGCASSGVASNMWRGVIWRCRLAWIGMAAMWVGLWMVNRQMESTPVTMVSARSRPTSEAVRGFAEQQRLLVELLQPTAPAPAEPARQRPQPRSEVRTALRSC